MYGVKEFPPNTIRPARLDHDYTNITQIFSETQVPLERNSIKDCHRLGKFKEVVSKSRPILIIFLCSGDASLTLAHLKVKFALNSISCLKKEARKQYC